MLHLATAYTRWWQDVEYTRIYDERACSEKMIIKIMTHNDP